jgi:phage protein D
MELEAGMDARCQFDSVKAAAWDPQNQEVIEAESASTTLNKQGNLTSEELAKIIGLTDYRLQTTVALNSGGLKAWADAQQVKSALARIRGWIKIQNCITIS